MPRSVLRRVVVPVIAALILVLVAAAVLGVGLTRRSFPQVDGELTLAGLSGEVEVLRDAQGVTHIYADTSEDLFMAQGFTAAQDRFFQMDLRRHVTAGRLAELVGEPGVETDTVIRTMGWRRVAEQELTMLDPQTRRYLAAYTAGVNGYLEQNASPSQVSLEYVVLGQSVPDYRIEPWTDVDSLAWLKAMAWDLRGNYADELARARLVGEVSRAQLGALYPDYPYDEHAPILSEDEWKPAAPQTGGDEGDSGDDRGGAAPPRGSQYSGSAEVAGSGVYTDTLAALDAVPNLLGEGAGIGSNSWVVSGEHTESGLPLLANDPHLGIAQPGVWMQIGLHCREVSEACPFDVTGFSFAGFPGIIIGHNTDIAWGLTNLDPDVTDFYLEEVNDQGQVRRGNAWEPVQQRIETIKVAGGQDVSITVRETRHGPILSDVLDPVRKAGQTAPINGVETLSTYDVSMAWTGLQRTRTADAVFLLNSAHDWDSFRDAARQFAVPSQNLIYADTQGNIGYQAPGLVPIRESSTNGQPPGFFPAQGWLPAYDWKGWVPFSQMPSTFNPADGVIVTANQAVTESNTPFLTSESDRGFRSQRIADLIAQKSAEGPLTTADMHEIQGDTHNAFADVLIEALLEIDVPSSDFYRQPQQMLADWDRTAPADGEQSAAAMYYYAVWANILDLTFEDELPADLAADGNSRWMLVVEDLLDSPEDVWWDDRRTAGVVETRDEILRQAMINARLDLTQRIAKDPTEWQWGSLHNMPLRHEVLGGDSVPDALRWAFNDGPYPAPGGSSLVNAFNWEAGSGSYRVTSGPSMRMVVDLADLDASTWVNQSGNSGHAFHPNYNDQTQAWLANESYPWSFSREAVVESAEHTLTLTP
ncbi:penicillin acylase family protein [Ornithinimicrobium ciconiae]|uniref:Penicillin acylase family protein n=1 Tax=Ornithinimicrobium ciconiae TaxID=2594265 RepID=A0A516GE59_9MICO|nr:penicillin acylase family protein [Ornithinimicrobium ciconiae]QDO89812.1 penicillin acylase family protein [Ornithinimicrobium ciconiae]